LHNTNISASTNSGPSYSLLDPNPYLIDIDGKLINNIDLAANLTTYRNGTIADGISKLVLIVKSENSLQFSVNDITICCAATTTITKYRTEIQDIAYVVVDKIAITLPKT